MKAILHIGTEKTGTTSLQEFLFVNRALLIERGFGHTVSCGARNNILLPIAAMDTHKLFDVHSQRLGIRTIEDRHKLEVSIRENLRNEVVDLNKKTCKVTLFSSEHFQSRLSTEIEVNRLRQILDDCGITVDTIIVYLRDPVELAASLYSTSLRAGLIGDKIPGPDSSYWHHICHHKNTILLWENVFPSAQLLPRIYNRERLVNNDIIDDFCSITGIALAGLTRPARQNESINRAGQQVLRYLNEIIPNLTPEGPNPLRYNLTTLINAHYSGPTPSLPRVLHESYRNAFRDSNEYIRDRFFPDVKYLFEEQAASDADESEPPPLDPAELVRFLSFGWKEHVREILGLREKELEMGTANAELKRELNARAAPVSWQERVVSRLRKRFVRFRRTIARHVG